MSVLGRAVVPIPDLPLGEGRHNYRHARAVCGRCELTVPCAEWAADSRQQFGFWGGLEPEQVAALRKLRKLRKATP